MKHTTIYKYIALTLAFFSLTSCNDWLDVRPKSQIKEEALFKTQSGFEDALFGVYTIMGKEDIYGGNSTMGFMDAIAQQYSSVGSGYNKTAAYDYKDDENKTRIENMWKTSYQAIMNCNYILKNIAENGSALNDSTRRLVEGEAIALRAYLHFDMLRSYAPSYTVGKDEPGVPLVNKVTNSPVAAISVKAMTDSLVADLIKARNLVKDIDPIGPAHDSYSEKYEDDYSAGDYLKDNGFWLYRTSRLNYYGMTALLARICLYKEDNANALKYAKEVIDSHKFSLISDALLKQDNDGYNKHDYSFIESTAKHEYISSIYVYDLKEKHNDLYYTDGRAALTIEDERRQKIFGATGLDFDIRAKNMFQVPSGNSKTYINKYMTGTQIPLLKLGEMYLIAAEASGDIEYLKTFRKLRGYTSNPLPEGDDLEAELQKEYQREFIGEGQLFYFYKRKNILPIPYAQVEMTPSMLILPEPDDEIEFGYSNN